MPPFQYLRCGMFHFAVLEGIVGAILAIVTALFARQHQRKRWACCLLHRNIGQIGAYESVRGWIHFKHCSRRLVIDILVHSEWAHIRAHTNATIHNGQCKKIKRTLYGSKRCRRHRTLKWSNTTLTWAGLCCSHCSCCRFSSRYRRPSRPSEFSAKRDRKEKPISALSREWEEWAESRWGAKSGCLCKSPNESTHTHTYSGVYLHLCQEWFAYWGKINAVYGQSGSMFAGFASIRWPLTMSNLPICVCHSCV